MWWEGITASPVSQPILFGPGLEAGLAPVPKGFFKGFLLQVDLAGSPV